MDKLNKTCIVCGEKYSYCNTCREYAKQPLWKSLFDKETCKDVFHIVSDYLQGTVDRDTTVDRLSHCDLSNVDNYKQSIRDAIKELTSSTEPAQDDEPTTIDEDVVNNTTEVSNKKVSRKRSKQSD
jgi:hypothetical protein